MSISENPPQPKPISPEITKEDLQKFRQEIVDLKTKGDQNQGVGAGHFADAFHEGLVFAETDLGPDDLKIWSSFKDCQAGNKLLGECLAEYNEYRQKLNQEKATSLARTGLASYIGNHLSSLLVRE